MLRAAGGVLWRDRDGSPGAPVEVALVHRPRYDDWSLPKGKLRRGEHPLTAAGREVLEETGVRPAVGPRLPSVTYPVLLDRRVVTKTVDYWAMNAVVDGGFAANAEVDDLSWLDLEQAEARLTYDHDRRVVARFAALPRVTGVVVLVRHATAGKRSLWHGADADRPLDPAGRGRARDLAGLLIWFAPSRFVSATPRRCVQTLVQAAARLGLRVDLDPAFDEAADPVAAAGRLRELGATGGSTVVCSQGGLMPGLLAALTGDDESRFRTDKGEGWVLSLSGAEPVQCDRLP